MSRLSPRELDVLRGAAHGLSQRGTAAELGISRKAVKSALLSAVERLGAATPHAVALAIRHGHIRTADIPGGTR